MLITQLSVKNWMGHEEQALTFSEGKNLVFGCNASGKSSLAKAIAFALTGQLPATVDPRRDGKEVAVIDLNIVTNEGKEFLVRRQTDKKYKNKPITSNIFIYDAANLAEALYTSEQAESFLSDLIGLSSEVFERVIYMKEEDVYAFLADPDNGILHEIDRLIGLQKAHDFANTIDSLTGEFTRLERDARKNRKEIETAVKRKLGIKQSKTDIKNAMKRMQEIARETEDLMELEKNYRQQQTVLDQLQKFKQSLKVDKLKDIETKFIALQLEYEEEREQLRKIINENTTKLAQLSQEQATFKAKKDLKEQIVQDLSSSEVSDCPTCGRKMDKQMFTGVLQKLKKEIKELEKQLKDQIAKVDSLSKANKTKKEKAEALAKKSDLMKSQKDNVSELFKELQTVEKKIAQLQKQDYPETIKGIKEQLDALGKEEKDLDRAIGRAEGAQKVTEAMVKQKKKKEDSIKHNLKVLELIKKAIQETTDKLRKEYIAEIKNQAEDIWKIYKGEPWHIDWTDDFVPKAKPMNADRELIAYEMSGSERFLILLAIRLAIQKTLEEYNLLIVDEPCQHLDESSGKIFRDILTDIGKKSIKQSIIFTYNQDFLKGDWNNIVQLTEE
jgi:DNA repair exonuclease SbcCD ATPase subunit